MVKTQTLYACDFCGKTENEVEHLIAGPARVAICEECVACCLDIVPGIVADREALVAKARASDKPSAT